MFTANIQHLCLMFLNPIFSRFTLLQFNVLYGSIIIIHSEMAVPFIIRACMAGVYFDCMGISFIFPYYEIRSNSMKQVNFIFLSLFLRPISVDFLLLVNALHI